MWRQFKGSCSKSRKLSFFYSTPPPPLLDGFAIFPPSTTTLNNYEKYVVSRSSIAYRLCLLGYLGLSLDDDASSYYPDELILPNVAIIER